MMARSAANAAQLFQEAQRFEATGDYPSAARLYEQILRASPRSADAHLRLGRIATILSQFKAARTHLGKAARLKPDDPQVLTQMALMHRALGEIDEAKRFASKARRLLPDASAPVAVLAELHRMEGEYDQVFALLKERFDKGDRDPNIVGGLGRVAHRFGVEAEIAGALHELADSPRLAPSERSVMLFILGGLYEKMGEYDRAFECYDRANAFRPTSFDPEGFDRLIDEIIEVWSKEFHASLPRASRRTDLPVFIIGMPRSGTSLLEQILACHAKVHGGGERKQLGDVAEGVLRKTGFDQQRIREALAPHRVERFHKDILRDLRKLDRSAERITDKMPYNFRHLPFIDLILPGARVIRMRRDPRDVCLSCFAQDFSGNHPFKQDLEHLGRFHQAYERLVDHWQSLIDAPFLEVAYEDLARDIEGETRRVLEFLGLAWDEACLRFHESKRVAATASNEQVRQPMYTSSIGRHRHFSAHLTPLYKALEIGANDPR